MIERLLSVPLWAVNIVIVLIWLPVTALVFAVTAPFDAGRYAAGWWFRRAAKVSIALNPLWDFRTSGVRITDPRRPYVAVANHESIADIFLISLLPWEMKWLSKQSIFRLPVMGWMMRMAGDIEVRRNDSRSRARAAAAIRDRLAKRVTVMVMPEGTRSRTDELLPFRDGAFVIAIETGSPILPIAVVGTRDAMRAGSLRFQRARAVCRVLEPIETARMTPAQVAELRDEVRSRIARAREQIRAELRAERSSRGRAPSVR